ncbi:MAG: VOC family protein [Pseudomonadota bacterium]
MVIAAIHHVQLAMPPGGEALARRFYAGLLGLAEVAKPADLAGRGGAWFERGGVRVHLGVEEPFVPARKAHPAFVVAGLAGVAARLRDAGVEIVPAGPVDGHARIHVFDPFGNRIELMEPREGG